LSNAERRMPNAEYPAEAEALSLPKDRWPNPPMQRGDEQGARGRQNPRSEVGGRKAEIRGRQGLGLDQAS